MKQSSSPTPGGVDPPPISSKIGEIFTSFKNIVTGIALPYDRTHPVIFDKDDYLNGYTGEYLLALASAGDIDLRGIVAGTVWPEADPDEILAGHRDYAARAQRSGMRNLPQVVAGAFRALQRPPSSRIEDTAAIDTPGTRLIVAEAMRATPEKPLVIVTGGSLTTVASAWLLEPSIAPRVVVAAALGREDDMGDYNGFMDGWASFIVVQKLRYVQFPAGIGPARVAKPRFAKLPSSEFRQWLIDKPVPYSNLPRGMDGHSAPAISVMRREYAVRARRVSFSHWASEPVRNVPHVAVAHFPALKNDAQGNALVVIKARQNVATSEFWRALSNSKAW